MRQCTFVLFVFAFAILVAACASPTPAPTPVPPTPTRVPPTATLVLPTATQVPPTMAAIPPTATRVPPTTTAIPPTATPTVTPLPTPAGVTFDFDDKVPALDRSLIQDGIAIGQHAFGTAGPIIVYGRTNLDSLMDAFHRHEKVSAQNPTAINIRRLLENGPSNGISMVSGTIYFYISDRWLRQPQAERMRGAAHEYFHQVQYALSGRNWQSIPSPTWLLEGSANYVTLRVFADYQFQESVRVRDTIRDMVWGLYSPLSSLETSEPVGVEDSRATYNLGYLATEFLVQNYGEPSISEKFWETRATTRTWQDAFRATFGISIEDFYNKFEAYWRANFPSYCVPSGDQTTLAMRLETELPPGSFHASPATYIPYVFCVTGTSVGTWTSAQKEKGFGKPIGLDDAGIGYCGGNCVVLAVRPNAPTGTYTFSVEAPDARKAETTFRHTQSTPVRPVATTLPVTPTRVPPAATRTLIPPPVTPDTCFSIDGQANDWQKLKPAIVDDVQPAIARWADVRQVYAATCRGALYLMIVTDGSADLGGDIEYPFHVDLTGDDNPEYQPGFTRTRAWLWNLKGTGYADMNSNLKFLSAQDYKAAIGTVGEFMLPLTFLENATSLRIRVYTVVGGQGQNRQTVWAKVQPLEAQ